MKTTLGIAMAALLGAAGAAGGEEGPARPFLRIETGMHTATIWRIDTDAAGRFLVSGSEDKTVRVWDLASGQLLQTLRPPIGDGNEGKIYSVAMSPDGELVAAAGFTGYQWDRLESIYIFERRSGRLIRRLSGLPEAIKDLAFSPDGSRLAAALGAANGLRVFRISDGRELGKDASYGGDSLCASFAADGRLVTASFDGQVRLYGGDLRLLAAVPVPGNARPYSVEFSPDGRKIAVGYEDIPRIDVLDGTDLHSLYSPDTQGTNLALGSVAWSVDGTVLYAAGRFRDQARSRHPIRRWKDAGRGAFEDLNGPENTVLDLRVLPNGRLAFGSADPAWGVLDATGKTVLDQRSAIPIFWSLNEGFRVDAGGSAVRFAYELSGRRPARFSLSERRIVLDPPEDARLAPPRTVSPGLEVTGWDYTREPRLAGEPLALDPLEVSRSLAIAPDGESFLLGTEWNLRSYRRDGSLRWSAPGPGLAWAVNLTGDGRLAVAAFSDGTIRWYRADDGRELLAFFPHADGKRWVLWTPGGYYDSSVDGEELIGWHVNGPNGPGQAADFFPAWQFRDRFLKPEVVDLILETLDEAEAVRRAGIRIEAQRPPEIRREELPPVVTILDPTDVAEVATPTVQVRVNVRSPSGRPVTRVWAQVDGQPLESRAAEFAPDPQAPDPGNDFLRTLEVPLPPGDHVIEVIAEVAGRISTPDRITVKRKAAQAPATAGRLFALVVGIAEYARPEYKLSFADDDARAVARLLRGQTGRSFGTVEIRELIDEKATLGALLDGLQWLDDSVGSEDTAVVFFAGHGINDREYFFLPHDANLERPVVSMLSQSQLQGVLTRLRGRVLLFLDTCRAGAVFGGSDDERRRQVDVTALLNSLTYSQGGLVVFSAATGRELSQERADWGHGAFTKALLEALEGAADTQGNRNGAITITELDSYLADRVRELTGGAQTPIQTRPPGVPSFTFVQVGRNSAANHSGMASPRAGDAATP